MGPDCAAEPDGRRVRPALLQPDLSGDLRPSAPGPDHHGLHPEHADQRRGRSGDALRPGVPVQPRLSGLERPAFTSQRPGVRRGLLSRGRLQRHQGHRGLPAVHLQLPVQLFRP